MNEVLVKFNIDGFDCGKLKTFNSYDIINTNLINDSLEDERFDPYDNNIELFPNFLSISQSFSVVEDFELISKINLSSEKYFEVVLTLPFFSNDRHLTIIETFEKQFPLCPFQIITPLEIKRLEGYGSTDFLFKFETKFPIEKYYPEKLFNKKEFNHVIIDDFFDTDYSKIEIETISDLNGKTAILEGDFYYNNGMYPKIIKTLKEENKSFKIIKNLYEEPKNLYYITDCDNLIIQTTGFNKTGLEKLIQGFKSLNYIPKRVIFVLEEIYVQDEMFKDVEYYKLIGSKRLERL